MKGWEKETNQQKHQFKSYYCLDCKQIKPCHLLSSEYCCSCFYHQKREKAQEYTNYQQVHQKKVTERKASYQQLKLLWEYAGCSQCGSKKADAHELHKNNKLVCQPCLVKKTSQSSSPITFQQEERWYQKRWGINLSEWLDNHGCLPVNADCAREWLKDKEHLKNCACLEKEVRETYELFTGFLRKTEEKLRKCACKVSEKPRTPYYDSGSYGYTYCEKCETTIKGAGKMGVIKNRNSPSFWGLEIKEKVLCGECLEERKGEMTTLKRAEFNRYRKKGRV